MRRSMSVTSKRIARYRARDLLRSHGLETATQHLGVGTFRMRDKKRLDCRFFRLVAAESAQRTDPSELGFLRQSAFMLAQVPVESREGAGRVVELGEEKPAERDERGAPLRAMRVARVSRAVSIRRFAERSLRSQRARTAEEIANRWAGTRFLSAWRGVGDRRCGRDRRCGHSDIGARLRV